MGKDYQIGKSCRKGHLLTEDTLFVSKNGHSNGCMICRREYNRKYVDLNRQRLNKRSTEWVNKHVEKRRRQSLQSTLKQKFNLSLEDYEQIVLRQNGKCLICGDLPKVRTDSKGRIKDRLDVDHCHKTGKVRGLLCHNCNKGLGQFKESLELLKNAVIYMEQFSKDQYDKQTKRRPLQNRRGSFPS